MIKRYEKGVHLLVSECKYAYVKGRDVVVERKGANDLKFPCLSAGDADRLATIINKDIDAGFVDSSKAINPLPVDAVGEGSTEGPDDIRPDHEGRSLH